MNVFDLIGNIIIGLVSIIVTAFNSALNAVKRPPLESRPQTPTSQPKAAPEPLRSPEPQILDRYKQNLKNKLESYLYPDLLNDRRFKRPTPQSDRAGARSTSYPSAGAAQQTLSRDGLSAVESQQLLKLKQLAATGQKITIAELQEIFSKPDLGPSK